MSIDRYRAPTEPDMDACEDAWYRALKAKASRRSVDSKDDTTDVPPAPVFLRAPTQNEGDAGAR